MTVYDDAGVLNQTATQLPVGMAMEFAGQIESVTAIVNSTLGPIRSAEPIISQVQAAAQMFRDAAGALQQAQNDMTTEAARLVGG